ncbi:ubiquitin-conjugating enzyme E2 Q2-like isoform X3 [Pongo abelii]|uniref:ubiquitin-conjugating enzyme E2 Q2-like isoform X3 n=1 Tax=Pongo abelii TaxID=9601 RepID=UPI0023E77407|nr:ubiquitin-conjugating enzyme E2 Q2-like isoform X2 [Pongo abelii]
MLECSGMTMTHCSCNQAQMIFPPQPPEWLEPQPWQILSVFPNGTKEEVTSKEDEEEEMDEDIEDLDHYEMKEEPISGKKLEDEGTEKENWAMLEKIRKTERQGHLNVVPDSISEDGVHWLTLWEMLLCWKSGVLSDPHAFSAAEQDMLK